MIKYNPIMEYAIFAIIGSALIHPLWIALPKKAAHPLTLNFWATCFIGITFSPFLLHISIWQRVAENLHIFLALTISQVIYTLSVLTFTKNHYFQIAYPMTRLGPILVLFAEIYLLHGHFSLLQIIGIFIASLGALLFGIDKHIQKVRGKFFLLLFVITITMASAVIFSKQLITVFSPAELWALTIVQLPFFLPFVLYKKKEAQQDLKKIKYIVGMSVAMVVTWGLALYALQELPAAVVSTGRNLSIIFGMFLGVKMFDEQHSWKRYIAGVLIVVGAAMALL